MTSKDMTTLLNTLQTVLADGTKILSKDILHSDPITPHILNHMKSTQELIVMLQETPDQAPIDPFQEIADPFDPFEQEEEKEEEKEEVDHDEDEVTTYVPNRGYVPEDPEFVCDKYELREGKKNPTGQCRFFDRSCYIRRVEKLDKKSFLYHLFHFDEPISIHRMTTEAKQALFEGDTPDIYSADHHLEPHQLTRCLKPGEDSQDFVFIKCLRFGPSCYRVVIEQRSTNEIVLRSIFKPNFYRIPGLAEGKETPTQDSEWAFDPRGSPLLNHWDLMILKHYYGMITDQELEEYNSVFIEEVSLL